MSGSNKLPATDYRLKNINNALYLDGNDDVVVRTGFVGNIVISGNVNVPGTINVNSSPENPVHVHLTELGTYGNLTSSMPVSQSGSWYVNNFPTSTSITTGGSLVSNSNPFAVNLIGNISGITSLPGINIISIPEVEIKNDAGNPIPISANTTVNSPANPIYVSNEGSQVVVGDLPAPSLSAFDEPLAVGITPVIQADAIYGLDPDFWSTTELNGGNVATTTDSVWQVKSGTSAGGYARLATSKYMTYQPGQGSMFRWTAAFTTTSGTGKNSLGVDNIVQNTGPIDREDGYSFGFSGATDDDAHRKIGILHRRAGNAETRALTITVAPTGAQTATITLNGVAYTVSLTTSTSVGYTAEQISRGLKAQSSPNNLWDIEACGGIITFTHYTPGAKTGTYSFSSTGTGTLAAGTFSQLAAGSTPTDVWTYVADWDNKSIQFDPSKLNVFGVDMRWLGAGRVRFFMEDPSTGKMVLVHTQKWSGQYLVPHINKPSLRLIYRSGTTNPAITPSQNVIVTGGSVFSGIQGMINQTGGSQGWFNIDSTNRAKDTVWHLLSIQNPYIRNNSVNKASIIMQDLTVATQNADPCVIYIVKNAVGTSDLLVYSPIPNSTVSMFAQYSASAVSENLSVDRITNIQTIGINSSAQFKLSDYNLTLSPGETVSVFINSSNAISRSSVGMTWKID